MKNRAYREIAFCAWLMLFANFAPSAVGQSSSGLGFFEPGLWEHTALFFYAEPPEGKTPDDLAPVDSIVWSNADGGGYAWVYGPPWFVPAHHKLDYDVLLLRVLSVRKDMLQVEGNESTGHAVYVRRDAGALLFWPDFLLRVHSVEFPPGMTQPLRFKPLDYAAEITTAYELLSPLEVRGDWVRVQLLDRDYHSVGSAWIRWREGENILLHYSLFS